MIVELLSGRLSGTCERPLDRLLNAALCAADPRKLTFVWARFARIELYPLSAILAVCRAAKSRLLEIFADSYRGFGPNPTRTHARD